MARPTRPESDTDAPWWNVKRAARELGYSEKWLRALCRRGAVTARQSGPRGDWKIDARWARAQLACGEPIDSRRAREHQGRRG